MSDPGTSKPKLQVYLDAEHTKCSICLSVWHDVVTVGPCLHNFCNGCFSEWLRRSQKKRLKVLCPQCRGVVQFVGKNHFLHNIEEDIIQSDSSLKRSEEEIAQLDSYAMIHSSIVMESGKNCERKRTRVESEAPDEDYVEFLERFGVTSPKCLQCGTEYNGFHCNEDTVHLQCHACGGKMPLRVNSEAPQHCLGCERPFCGAYLPAQGNALRYLCSLDSFKPISDHSISIIPHMAHETNQVEKDVTERSIRQMGRTLPDVVSEWIAKLDNGEIVNVTINWCRFSCTGSALPLPNIIYHRMLLTGLIVGMATSAGHSTITNNMLVEGITSVVRLGAPATIKAVAVGLVPDCDGGDDDAAFWVSPGSSYLYGPGLNEANYDLIIVLCVAMVWLV